MAEYEGILLSRELEIRLRRDHRTGKRLPSERLLAEKYCCDRGTIRSAIKGLSGKGLLESVPRKGHFLINVSPDTKDGSGSRKNPSIPNVALLTFGNALKDSQIMDVIAGAVSKGTSERVHVTLVDLSDNTFIDEITSLESFCPGGNVDGFILCGKPPSRIKRIVEKSVRPCVILGSMQGENEPEKTRSMRVLAALEPAYKQAGYHLGVNKHRKVMLVGSLANEDGDTSGQLANAIRDGVISAGVSDDVELDVVSGNIWDSQYKNFVVPSKELAEKAVDSLDGHTALIVACGGILGLEIWKRLLSKGIRIPDDLSVVIAGGRNDHFIETFDIASVFEDGWHCGEVCVEEIVKQFSSGDISYGMRFTNSQYLSRKTVGLAKNSKPDI